MTNTASAATGNTLSTFIVGPADPPIFTSGTGFAISPTHILTAGHIPFVLPPYN